MNFKSKLKRLENKLKIENQDMDKEIDPPIFLYPSWVLPDIVEAYKKSI
jgi:hypothetical protein